MNNHSTAKSDILVIISMHRSGSSLTASLLQSAGLHIGRNLMEGDEKNVKGYYENLDFYGFHRSVLASQGVDESGWTLQEKIEVEDRFIEKAKELVAKAAVSSVWGWKEPRTTLFLEFWADLLPQANFLLMYRAPWEVVESLYRQNHGLFKTQPELAVKLWVHYNQKIINFYNHSSNRCLLVNTKTLIQNPTASIEAINQKFKLHLAPPDASIYDPSLFRNQGLDSYRPSLIESLFPEAVNLYQELDSRAWFPQNNPDLSWRELIKPSPYRIWAFQDWVNVCKLEKENKKLCSQLEELERLEQSQSQLHETEGLLEQSQSQLYQTQALLSNFQSQLQQTEGLLDQSHSQLHETESLLEQSQSQLHETESLLEQSQSQLHETESLLEQSQSQLHETEGLLEQFHSQLHETEDLLEQSQSQLQQTKVKLQQSQSQLHETESLLEQSQSQLQHSHRENEQAKWQVGETETLLKQSQLQLQQTESSLEICMSQLRETRAEMEISQSQHHETHRKFKRLQSQHHKIQEELEQSQSQQHQTEALLEEYESQLHQTQQDIEQLQSQYHQTEALLEECESHLYEAQQELEQSQSQQQEYESLLNQAQQELEQSQSQQQEYESLLNQAQQELEQSQFQQQEYESLLNQTQQELEQSLSQQHQTEAFLQEYESHIQHLQIDLQSKVSQLAHTQRQLEESNYKIHQIQFQIDRLEFQQAIAINANGNTNSQYKLLVWDAWYAYHNGDLAKMQDCLKQSLKSSHFSPTDTVSNWLESFSKFSGDKGHNLDTFGLTNLAEWKQLMRFVLNVKPVAVKF